MSSTLSAKTPADPGERLTLACRHLERAVALLPGHAESSALLGRALLLTGDATAAVPILSGSLAADPAPRTAFLLGIAQWETGDPASAEVSASRAVAENDTFGKAWALRAVCRDAQASPVEALEDLRKSVECSPRFEVARLLLSGWLIAGRASSAPAEIGSAGEAALRVLAQHPFEIYGAAAIYLAACAHLIRGEADRALKILAGAGFPSAIETSFRRGLAQLILGAFSEAEAELAGAAADPSQSVTAGRFLDLARNRQRLEPGRESLPPPRLEALPRICAATLLGSPAGAATAKSTSAAGEGS